MLFLQDLDRCYSLAYSPDGTCLALGGAGEVGQGMLILWDWLSGQKRTIFLHGGPVQAVAFSPDGRWLAAAVNRSIRLIDLATAQLRAKFSRHTRSVSSLAFSPGGRFLISAAEGRSLLHTGGEVNRWDLQRWKRGRPRLLTSLPEYRGFCSVAYLRGRRILLGSKDGEIFLWDVAAKEYQEQFKQRAAVRSLAVSPKGGRLATAAGRVVHIWNLKENRHLGTLKGHKRFVRSVAFTPNGKILLSGSWDGMVRMWGVSRKRLLACFDWGIGKIEAVAVAPDGMTAAAAGQGAVVWDLESGY